MNRANVLATYRGLTRPVRGAKHERRPGWEQARGPADLSFTNWAAGFDLPEDGVAGCAAEVRDLAQGRPGFSAFFMSPDRPKDMRDRLGDYGFRPFGRLTALACEPVLPESQLELTPASTPDEREEASRFMARQFFWRGALSRRREVIQATAQSPHRLYAFREKGKMLAAVMLTETSGCLGIYNLCVEMRLRGRGLGGELLKACLAIADKEGAVMVLQSDPDFSGWYEERGFRIVDEVVSYRLRGA